MTQNSSPAIEPACSRQKARNPFPVPSAHESNLNASPYLTHPQPHNPACPIKTLALQASLIPLSLPNIPIHPHHVTAPFLLFHLSEREERKISTNNDPNRPLASRKRTHPPQQKFRYDKSSPSPFRPGLRRRKTQNEMAPCMYQCTSQAASAICFLGIPRDPFSGQGRKPGFPFQHTLFPRATLQAAEHLAVACMRAAEICTDDPFFWFSVDHCLARAWCAAREVPFSSSTRRISRMAHGMMMVVWFGLDDASKIKMA